MMSTIILDCTGCTTANFDNLPTHVRNCFLSVEKMSMCNISPVYLGMGVSPSSRLLCNLQPLFLLSCSFWEKN